MVTDHGGRESAMSMSTAISGELVNEGGQSQIKKTKPKVQITDYEIGKTIGQGAYGRVMLGKEIATG